MNDAVNDQRLQDYVDGLLDEDEAEAVRRAVAESPEARATVDFLRALGARTAELPRSIEPRRDLWPDIVAKMAPAPLTVVQPSDTPEAGPPGAVAAPLWTVLRPTHWASLAAAAMVLVALSSGITAWMVAAGGSATPDGTSNTVVAAAGGELAAAEATYALEIEQLMRVLYDNRESLDPDTVSTIETNLRVIDRAIDRVREALAEDPSNVSLTRMLGNNYRHKLELLQRASRIIELS